MAVSKVTIKSIASDGTNLFLDVEVFNGDTTLPILRPIFPVGTSASTIQDYLEVIANNRPTLAADIAALVNSTVVGS
jgi:hypothetical protein